MTEGQANTAEQAQILDEKALCQAAADKSSGLSAAIVNDDDDCDCQDCD